MYYPFLSRAPHPINFCAPPCGTTTAHIIYGSGKMDTSLLWGISLAAGYLLCVSRHVDVPLDNWIELGYYRTRDLERLSRTERWLLPYLTGVPNIVPLYKHRHCDMWAYRIRGGPWINPTPDDLVQYAIDENEDSLLG